MAEENWRALLSEASRLRVAGHVDAAASAYERLLAVKPDLPDSWYNLGWLQQQARAFEEALSSYQRALDLAVPDPEEVHLNRAVIYSDHLHRPHDAEQELRAALTRNPNYTPALLNLGNLMEDFGDRRAACAAYQQVLGRDPDNLLALARLALLSATRELDLKLEQRVRAALQQPGTPLQARADLGFALGAMLDAAGDYEAAFSAYRAANDASRATVPGSTHYDRERHEHLVDRLIQTFARPTERSPVSGKAPIYICGMFRSGSTLVEQMLASHSNVTAGGEIDSIAALVSRIPDYPETVAVADRQTIQAWRDFYLKGISGLRRDNHLITDKRPDNFLHIGLIKTLFPDARIVHTRRNPLDNLLSLYFLHLDPRMAYALDLADAAHWHGQYAQLMAHWKMLYPDDILDIDYDELVREPRPLIGRLLAFCGLEWEDACLEFHRNRNTVKTASVWQVREPLHARSSGRWRNYERQLEPLRNLLLNETKTD